MVNGILRIYGINKVLIQVSPSPVQGFSVSEIGSLICDQACAGEVVSTHPAAVNILMPSKLLFSIVKFPNLMTDLSICVPAIFKSEKLPEEGNEYIRKGDNVVYDGNSVVFNKRCINLHNARIWRGILSFQHSECFDLQKIMLLRRALIVQGKKGGLLDILDSTHKGNVFVEKSRRILEQIRKTTIRTGEIKGLSKLVGLGIGFTPSGDDFISGALLGEEFLSFIPLPGKGKPTIIKTEISGTINKTNHGGRTLLWQTLQSRFPAYLLAFAHEFRRASNQYEMEKTVTRAASHGQTSGTDAALGFFWTLQTYQQVLRLTK